MFKNYLKIALRHISRNKGYVFINILGLGIALACSIIAFVNWQSAAYADSFHQKSDNIFRIIHKRLGVDTDLTDVSTVLVEKAVAEIAEVEAGVRFNHLGAVIKSGPDVFIEQLSVADANFFDVFTFPLVAGNPADLKDPSKIFISEVKAKKYFGNESAIGKTLTINPGQDGQKDFEIAGVVKEYSEISCLDFDFLVNTDYVEHGSNPDTLSLWKNRMTASFLLLNRPESKEMVAKKLNEYIPIQNEKVSWSKTLKYLLIPLHTAYKAGMHQHNNRLKKGIHPAFYWSPILMALLILLTACLNFTNTTISFSNKRLKEMGVRKVMGGSRTQLIAQLLGESLVVCLLGLGLGIILAEYLTPLFNAMWARVNVSLSLDYWNNTGLLTFMIGAVLFATILGGAYPALYISSFRPAHIFRGNTKFGGDSWFVRFLLGLQILISLGVIIGGITFAENAEYQKNFDLGYNVDGIINVTIQGEKQYQQFKNVISENPDIQGVAGSSNNLGFGEWWWNIGKPEENRHAQAQLVGEDFFEVMGIRLLEGRRFDKNLETDFENAIIINQKLMQDQHWTSGLEKELQVGSRQYKVIGVSENLYTSSFFSKPPPSVFFFYKPEHFRVLKVKVAADKMLATNDYLKQKWVENFPLVPYESRYQDEVLATTITICQNVVYVHLFLALITILLVAIGLYALVSLNVLKRAKEIAVRRVFGARPEDIIFTINKHYLWIFGIASVLGALYGIWLTRFLIEAIFEVHQGVNTASVIFSVLGICLIGFSTIGGKIYKVLKTNPAETLKSE